jgi:hypothetical protein
LNHFTLPFAGEGAPAIIALAVLLLSGYAALAAWRASRWHPVANGSLLHRIAIAAVSLLWVGVIIICVWSLTIRPIGGDTAIDHNPVNLLRIFAFIPAVPLLVLLFGLPFTLQRSSGTTFVALLAAGVGTTLLLFDSHHSSPDIWWSRRYLLFVPVGVAGVFCVVASTLHGDARRAWMAILLIGGLVQFPLTYRLVTSPVNPDAGATLDRLLTVAKSHRAGAVLALEGGRAFNASMNTFRSAFAGEVLLGVPRAQLDAALEVLKDAHCPLLASSMQLDVPGWELVWTGEGELLWFNTTTALLKGDALQRRASSIHLYSRCLRDAPALAAI